jgi:hypothetical protein
MHGGLQRAKSIRPSERVEENRVSRFRNGNGQGRRYQEWLSVLLLPPALAIWGSQLPVAESWLVAPCSIGCTPRERERERPNNSYPCGRPLAHTPLIIPWGYCSCRHKEKVGCVVTFDDISSAKKLRDELFVKRDPS